MKNVMKKTGWTVVSLLPVLLALGIQVGCAMAATVIITMVVTVQEADSGLGMAELTNLAAGRVMDNMIPILIVSQLVLLLVFGLWYYFAYGRKKRPEGTPKPLPLQILLIVATGIGAQFFISSILTIIGNLAPWMLESYNELMEQSGIFEGTALTLLSTVVLAPLSEELVCRGVILRLAGKVSPKFWVANVIQAVSFGILHGNLVQGIYAFALGLVLGAVYGRFRNIWLCMLLHGVMNASSLLVEPVYAALPGGLEQPSTVVCILLLAVSGALLALCMKGVFGKNFTEKAE